MLAACLLCSLPGTHILYRHPYCTVTHILYRHPCLYSLISRPLAHTWPLGAKGHRASSSASLHTKGNSRGPCPTQTGILFLSFFLSWCVQARGHTQMCLLRSHSPWFSETKSLTGLEVTKQATLAGQGKQRDPRLCLSSTGMTGACCHTQVWEITLRSLCRHG